MSEPSLRDTHWSKRRKYVKRTTLNRQLFDLRRALREFGQAIVKSVRDV